MSHPNGIPTTTIVGDKKRPKPDPHFTIRHKHTGKRLKQPGKVMNASEVEALLKPFGALFNLLEEIGAPVYSGDIGGMGTALYDAAMIKLQALGKEGE
ncbi:hypothetical protein [Solidesulfovibrio sp.]